MEQSVEITREEIGRRVRHYRMKNGWTDNELGQMVGMSGKSLNNKERGDRDFTWDEIIRLADVFKITLDELIRGIKPENLPAAEKMIIWVKFRFRPQSPMPSMNCRDSLTRHRKDGHRFARTLKPSAKNFIMRMI